MATLHHVGLGARFAGRCAVCGRDTGSRPFELAATSLYKDGDGKFRVVHPICANGKTKNKVGGGMAYRVEPDETIEAKA